MIWFDIGSKSLSFHLLPILIKILYIYIQGKKESHLNVKMREMLANYFVLVLKALNLNKFTKISEKKF